MEKGPQHTLFLTRLEGWDEDHVLHTAKQVRELMTQPGWLVIQQLITEAKAVKERLLHHGPVESHAVMARMAGEIHGLSVIEGAAEAVLIGSQQIMEKREEAERRAAASGGS